MNRAHHTTPRKINKRVRSFLRKAALDGKSLYLELTDVPIPVFEKYCLDNCKTYSSTLGGTIIFGWMIWDAPYKDLIEAEFHAVIKTGKSLIDITPRVDGEKNILFVEDNIRKAICRPDGNWETWKNIVLQNGVLSKTQQVLSRGISSVG